MVTMMTLELYRFDELSLHQQLQSLVAKAPRFFENTPVVVGLEHLHAPDGPVDLIRLCTMCSSFGINLIAIRGGSSQHRSNASEAGLACLAAQPQATIQKPRAFVKKSVTFENSKVTPIHQNERNLKQPADESTQLAQPTEHASPSAQLYIPPRVISTPYSFRPAGLPCR